MVMATAEVEVAVVLTATTDPTLTLGGTICVGGGGLALPLPLALLAPFLPWLAGGCTRAEDCGWLIAVVTLVVTTGCGAMATVAVVVPRGGAGAMGIKPGSVGGALEATAWPRPLLAAPTTLTSAFPALLS